MFNIGSKAQSEIMKQEIFFRGGGIHGTVDDCFKLRTIITHHGNLLKFS